MNILNPALTAELSYILHTYELSGDKVWISLNDKIPVDGYSGATALSDAYNGLVSKIPSFLESFIGIIPGSASETSALLILVGATYLIISGVGSWRIIISGILGGLFMSLVFNYFSVNIETTNYLLKINPVQVFRRFYSVLCLWQLICLSFSNNNGKWIYGFMVGFLGILIHY